MIRIGALVFSLLFFSFLAQSSPVTAGKPAEVTLELTAHDKKGNPVLDLDRSEVQITEGGKPVPLSSLRLVKAPQVAPFVTLVFDEVVPGVSKTDADLANQFLEQAAGKGLVMTVLRVEGRLRLMQPPTTDLEAVKKAVDFATVANRKECLRATDATEEQMEQDAKNGAGPRQMMAKVLKAMLLDSQSIARDPHSTPAVAALLAASRGLQILPGRKYIVFFGQGLPYHSNTPEVLRDITQAAARARVSIYAVDAEIGDSEIANSLITTSNVGTQEALGNFTASSTDAQGTGSVSAEFTSRITSGERGPIPKSLEEICLRSGGADVYALASDSGSRARGIATDITSYYLASWITPDSDGEARAIRVQLLRKGVALLPRFPARVAEREPVSRAEARLLEALAAPVPPADLPVNAAVIRFTPDHDINSVVVQAPLDHAAAVAVLAQLKDESNAVVQRFSADIPQQTGPISFRRQFNAPPGEYVLESAVMDSAAGKIGTRREHVAIPPAAHGVALGDVVLVARIDAAATPDAADPLRCAQGIVVPNLSGRVSKATNPRISLFFDLYTDPASADAPALSAELRRDGALIGTVPLKLTVDPKRPGVPYLFTLGTGSLRPGHYQTTVVLSQGSQKASESASFTLE